MTQPRSRAPGTRTFEGSYPVSAALQWHNGLHLVAPHATAGALPVCAIADGKVIFVSPPTPLSADPAHPQNYMPNGTPAWTDNGCLIVEHSTDIGAAGNTSTQIVYYSLYMHLSQIEATVKLDSLIYRKDLIGMAGQFHGAEHQLHFEICCDKANLDRLIGREALWTETEPPVTPTTDGRTDTVFGEVVIYLPASTPVSPKPPTSHVRTSSNSGTAGATLGTAQWVGIRHDKGSAILRSIDLMGQPIGIAGGRADKDFEYDLYLEASKRNTNYLHHSPPATGPTAQITSSPSGWYELLRFGRNLGPDPLPADAAHWREIPTATGTVWADLNAIGSYKFSEADFLAVTGWNFFDDDETPLDMRCDSVELKRWIRDPDPANAERMDRVQLGRRLGEPAVQQRLRRAICNFPSEWDAVKVKTRLEWLRDPKNGYGLEQEHNWTRFITYCQAVTFTDLPDAYLKATWRMHPGEFIEMMRRCGWLSTKETVQLVPKYALRRGKDPKSGLTGPILESIPERNADANANRIFISHQIPLNRAMRKYGINNSSRKSAFFGNAVQETTWMSTLQEGNGSKYWYAPWYGRGFLQLTHSSNYINYWEWRGKNISANLKKLLLNAQLSEQSKTPSLRNMIAMQDQNFSIPNEIIEWRNAVASLPSTNAHEAALAPSDSAGFCWSSLKMAVYADAEHILERVEVDTVNEKGKQVYYRSPSFWKASAAVNFPNSMEKLYNPLLNGFESRCCAYAASISILTEMKFPNSRGTLTLPAPEGNSPRRIK